MLHESEGICASFSRSRIYDQVIKEIDSSKNAASIMHNISVHCRANLPARPMKDRHCKLYWEGRDRYRLYRSSEDVCHPSRRGCLVEPDKEKLPQEHRWRIGWYHKVYCKKAASSPSATAKPDPAGARAGRASAAPVDGARANGRSEHAGWEQTGTVDVMGLRGGPPPWATEAVTRAVRNTSTVRCLKNLYEDKCQVCGRFIQVAPDRRYSEVHHLRPLGSGGDDNNPGNMLVLCPTHHVEFDYAVLGVSEDGRSAVDRGGRKRPLALLKHSLDPKNVAFQLGRMGPA